MALPFDKELDVRGAKCPVPVVKARQAVNDLQVGLVLRVLAPDPGSVNDFKGWAQAAKNIQLLAQETDRRKRYLIAFFGGFVMLFGARLAGGCTSGHMISGVSQLALSSFVFAVTIFLTGVLTAKALYDWRRA